MYKIRYKQGTLKATAFWWYIMFDRLFRCLKTL